MRASAETTLPAVIAATRSHGDVHVVSRVVGFKKIKFYTNENVGSGELDLPEQQMHTTSYWLTLPPRADGDAALRPRRSPRRCRRPGIRDEAGGAAAPDVRPPRPWPVDQRRRRRRATSRRRQRPSAGARRAARSSSTTTIRAASASASRSSACTTRSSPGRAKLIAGCPCDRGCPSCVGPVGETGPLAKQVALTILERLLRPALA